MIKVKNLNFDYPEKRVLKDVAFFIEGGSITALAGPNGAGKTTLLNCLAGLQTPISGNIEINGVSVIDEPRRCHEFLGFLPDNFGLYVDLTVRQCLTYFARAHNIPPNRLESATISIAERLGLIDHMSERAGSLSRGWRQKLGIAQTLIHDPEIIFLDEPASGLDPMARKDLSRFLVELQKEGKTLIVSSHILAELEDYSTHMMIIQDGRLLDPMAVGQHATQSTKILVLELYDIWPPLTDFLSAVDTIDQISIEGTRAQFQFAGDLREQNELLKKLVNRSAPVCALQTLESNLQDSYLEQMKRNDLQS